jgi:RNA polymerase sigma-70 factor, ECF subfamily
MQMDGYAMDTLMISTLLPSVVDSNLTARTRPISELDDIDALVRTYRARLLRFVAYSTGDLDLAETITQDTLLRAYNSRNEFRGECSLNTWLTGIAINVIRDHLRTKRYRFWRQVKSSAIDIHEVASFLPVDGLSSEGQLLVKEKVEQMHKVLEKLSHNQRTVFLMKFVEELPVSDISTTLGMPVNTVRTHLHRALKAVRSQLGAGI